MSLAMRFTVQEVENIQGGKICNDITLESQTQPEVGHIQNTLRKDSSNKFRLLPFTERRSPKKDQRSQLLATAWLICLQCYLIFKNEIWQNIFANIETLCPNCANPSTAPLVVTESSKSQRTSKRTQCIM